MNTLNRIPAIGKSLLVGGISFLLISIIASLRFTPFASLLTLIAAIVVGFGVAFYLKKKEMLVSSLVTILPNILLQWLYFSDVGKYMDWESIMILLFGNIAIITVCALIGGLMALLIRKKTEKKLGLERERIKKQTDTHWIDRLFVSILLFAYLVTYVIPIVTPVNAKEKQTVNEFLNTYDPDKDYQPYAEAVVEPPQRRMPLEGAEQYYNQFPDIPPEVIDEILTKCGTNCNITETLNTFRNDPANFQIYESIGIPKWQDTYPEADGYSSGVWSTTIGGLIDLGKALKKDFWGTSKAVGKGLVQSLDRGMIMTNPMYATQRFIGKFGKDMKSYYGSATHQILKGNIKQGISDFINIPKFLGFLVNKNYSGGTKQLVKDTQNPIKVTSWMVLVGAISHETAKAYQQGNYRYASSRAAGEVTGTVLMLALPGVAKAGVGKIAQISKTTFTMSELATGTLTTKNGINIPGYTYHGLFDAKINRKIPTMDIVDALKEPLKVEPIKIKPNGPSQRFIGKKAEVAVNPETGKIVSTNKTSTKESIKLQKQK